MARNLECWEDVSGLCFWMVPLGIFLSFIALGAFCGFCLACCCSNTGDDEEDDAQKEDSTIR